ncbi:indolepyruvate ferredoxin oxidoreductase subunit alpha [Umezawaea sp.]|uniref:indolepyruvate ferredoxin oxidoreductase subunit alpha n=1 Tax=Umezawaea sp. TaxID=1955258 RepID=UPI002ED0A40B
MTYTITSRCVGTKDESCVTVCPVDCIHDAGEQMMIDPVECIDCGACVPICPVDAIFTEDEVPAEEQDSIEAARSFYGSGGPS